MIFISSDIDTSSDRQQHCLSVKLGPDERGVRIEEAERTNYDTCHVVGDGDAPLKP